MEANYAGQDFKKYTNEEIIERLPMEFRDTLRKNLNEKLNSGRKVRVYCDGVFDMFHFGHMRMLKQIKDLIPNVHLIVGVCADKDIIANKGSRIMTDDERIESVKHCKWVDEIYFPAPWCPDVEFAVSQDFDFIAHDVAPYGGAGTADVYHSIKEMGMFLPTLRTDGISTSDLMARILKDRTDLMIRNLGKGVPKDEMGINTFEYLFQNVRRNYRRLEKMLTRARGRLRKTIGKFSGEDGRRRINSLISEDGENDGNGKIKAE